jgi:hypothetical protein
MKPDRIDVQSDDGSDVVENVDLGHSEDRLVISAKNYFPLPTTISWLGRLFRFQKTGRRLGART